MFILRLAAIITKVMLEEIQHDSLKMEQSLRTTAGMSKLHVVFQVAFGSTFVIAQLASKWLFTGMNSVVGLQSALSGKTLIAV